MLKSLYIAREKFTKLKFITKFYDKSNFLKSIKINKISYILQVQNVRTWYLSNKSEIAKFFLNIIGKMAISVYFTIKRTNMIEFICFDVTFISADRNMQNSCIHKNLLQYNIISSNYYKW